MKPENGIKSRHLKRRHVAATTDTIVDLVVHVLEAAERAWAGVGVPPVEAEGVKVAVGEQEQADVAAQRGQLVG